LIKCLATVSTTRQLEHQTHAVDNQELLAVRRLTWDLGSGTWELGVCTMDVSSCGVMVHWFASGCSVGF
jgi:hypothetical protein